MPDSDGKLPVQHVLRELRHGAAMLRRAARPGVERERDDFFFFKDNVGIPDEASFVSLCRADFSVSCST